MKKKGNGFSHNKKLFLDTKEWNIPVGGLVHYLLAHCYMSGTSLGRAHVKSTQYSSQHLAACEVLGLLEREMKSLHLIYHITDVGLNAFRILEKRLKIIPYTDAELKIQIALGTIDGKVLTVGGANTRYKTVKGFKTVKVPVKINKERYEHHLEKAW